jgi:Domain of unknown function (DUF4335)
MPVLARPISRIYTPPTCTLEVTAQPSALSRWTGTPVIKSLQFLLSFEGLSQGDREPIEIRGDQTQLATLSNVVTDYIQTVLASRASDLSIRPSPSNHPTAALNESAVSTESPPPAAPDSSIQLRPRSLLSHELTLGSLANERSGSSLVLKVSQLYDLATALDDSAVDLQHLPTLSVASPSWRNALPLVSSAAILLLTVGLGSVAWRLFQPGLVAVKQPPRSPDTKTALAPPASPSSSKALPSLRPRPSAPLTLPSIKLPSRSDSPSDSPDSNNSTDSTDSTDKTDRQADRSASLGQSSAKPSTSSGASGATNTAPQSSAQKPGEIAPAPASEPNSAARTNSAADSQLSTSQFESRGGLAENRPMAKSSSSDASNARQRVGQSSLFDTIAQVAEVRDYVASRWQPASPPPRTLEYRLKLNTDGSLAQVDPLGASAQQYLGQLPLPTPQSPFVSALGSGGRPTVRLVVHPDGTVQTFLDGSGR